MQRYNGVSDYIIEAKDKEIRKARCKICQDIIPKGTQYLSMPELSVFLRNGRNATSRLTSIQMENFSVLNIVATLRGRRKMWIFSDKCEEDEKDIEDFDEEPDEWLIDNRNALDEQMKSWEIEYWKIAEDMKKYVELIRYGRSAAEKKAAASNLKRQLEICLDDMNLMDLTAIYRGLKENNVKKASCRKDYF